MEEEMALKLTVPLLAIALFTVACGTAFKTGNPWNPGESRLFDDGIDLLADPGKLSGKWGYEAENELDARSNLADMVAVVEILSVQTNTDLDGKQAKRIAIKVVKTLYGSSPSSQFPVISAEDSFGYKLIIRHEASLSGRQIMFIRWFDEENGSLGSHFHFSPYSKALTSSLKTRLESRVAEEEAQKK